MKVLADKLAILSGWGGAYRAERRLLGISSRPRTMSAIGVEKSRQIRSRVRRVIGFPASIFCQ
jgi:hypothetical protein